ncbi:branched-chain amino acid transport system ATP-binding protein [Streptosporangium becharense]|uniref:Branched-chain amino acid transport system ATP-binding protein n=1 Tax=Streptosporangium becharense TaxID=1816182 RepID=A0A7W9ICW6_9ACTN|nr:ABC transporter ATP-binding protein [Streptosporangium becharense]MBB2915230.1 branched-chain amino acid transport system ATP-binding protein [Streptosporangium becharense]MBB5817941.1 branched-chain amino acid transport system ATP-binding protein [Streptosporangium becharense]
MLDIDGLDVHYGGVHALRGLSLTVSEGEIVALLGNNGAGKTTTLAAVSGLVRPSGGRVVFDGREVTREKPHRITARGLVHVPEGRRIFSTLTVHENLQVGGYLLREQAETRRRIDRVYELLPRLAERRGQQGGTLSGGEQQMLAIGRALVTGPRLLLLDEPSMGLAPLVVASIMELIAGINAEGTSVLLVEQNATAALRIAHRGYVVENGACVLDGPAAELREDPRVVEAYLGGLRRDGGR